MMMIRSLILLLPLHLSVEAWMRPAIGASPRSATTRLHESSTRRDWISSVAASTAAMTLAPSTSQAMDVITTTAVCDPTVSVWRRGDRIIYLLGTAHISSVSANLAAELVHDTHPDAVFVELDLKRVGGVPLAKGTPSSTRLDIETTSSDGTSTRIVVPVPSKSSVVVADSPAEAAAVTRTPDAPPSGLGIRQKLLGFGAAAVGNAIRGMYKNIENSGFQPGDEFVQAIKEGQKIGAAVVLGDQDVEVTLRRLTEALAQTDLNKLIDPDSDLERSMKELLPGGGNGSPEDFKNELSSYVETIKTRDNVKRIMAQLKEVAPALVQVMLTERDAYMSAGLDTLNDFSVVTAVMGLAHVDGVERNLKSMGWQQAPLKCPTRA